MNLAWVLISGYNTGREEASELARLFRGVSVRLSIIDVNDPAGVALLALHENPAFFATELRALLHAGPFAGLRHRPELTMLGRTYASGFEPDLDDWLLGRPRRTVLNPAWPWGIWYPLRRATSAWPARGSTRTTTTS